MKRALRLLGFLSVIGILAFLLSKFFQDNSDPIQVQLLGFRTKAVSSGLFVILVFLSGVGLSLLIMLTAVVAKAVESGRLRRENTALQRMLEDKAKEGYSSSSKITVPPV